MAEDGPVARTPSSITLPAIVDFDGTLVTTLDIDWGALAAKLRAPTILEQHTPRCWATLRDAELVALTKAKVNDALVERLSAAGGKFAILTNNSEDTVRTFLAMRPKLAKNCVLVIGRESLPDSKENQVVWRAAVRKCKRALGIRLGEPWSYVGDSGYELRYARAAGARVWQIALNKVAPQRFERSPLTI